MKSKKLDASTVNTPKIPMLRILGYLLSSDAVVRFVGVAYHGWGGLLRTLVFATFCARL